MAQGRGLEARECPQFREADRRLLDDAAQHRGGGQAEGHARTGRMQEIEAAIVGELGQ